MPDEEREFSCRCWISAPCDFCFSLTEDEADIVWLPDGITLLKWLISNGFILDGRWTLDEGKEMSWADKDAAVTLAREDMKLKSGEYTRAYMELEEGLISGKEIKPFPLSLSELNAKRLFSIVDEMKEAIGKTMYHQTYHLLTSTKREAEIIHFTPPPPFPSRRLVPATVLPFKRSP